MMQADKAACCVAQATCGDADGAGAGTAGVTDADCGAGSHLRNTTAHNDAALCQGAVCDMAVAEDKAACCEPLATCGDKDGAGLHAEPITDAECGALSTNVAMTYDTTAAAAPCAGIR